MTQEEKIANRRLLDMWMLKAQLKDFVLKSRAAFVKQARGVSTADLATELSQQMSETVKAAQLN